MNVENEKLLKVKKSCKAVKVVTLILFIVSMLATVLSLVMGIAFFAMGDKFDALMTDAKQEGYIKEGDFTVSANVSFINIDLGDPTKIDSDIPFLKEKFENGSYSTLFSTYMLGIFFILIFTDMILYLLYLIFKAIEKESTPFCDKVIKKMIVIFVLITIVAALSSGLGFALLSGFAAWAIITIMEYGKQLQIESDETL